MTALPKFTGQFEHSLDDKGRLTIPARLRGRLGDHFVLTIAPPELCLSLYPEPTWSEFCTKLESATRKDARYRSFVRHLFANTEEVSLDAQGRVVVPQALRDYAEIDKDVVLEADTDVVGHINGGHTALPDDQIRCICEGCKRGLELVHNGNERSALYTLRTAREMGDLARVILGTDAPAGSGVQPLGILRMVSLLSSLGEVPAEIAFCFATGNTARMRALDCGIIEAGRAADFVIMDRAQHSAGKNLLDSVQLGDLPGVGMTIIDGIVRTQRSRNTPPATKLPEIVGH